MLNKSLFLLFLIFILSGCAITGQFIPSSTPTSGIQGYVTEGPMCPGPVAIGKNECPNQPYQATILVLDSNSHEIARLQTDATGYFSRSLEPGTYILRPLSAKPLPHAADQTVSVSPGEYTQVTIVYDTGMR